MKFKYKTIFVKSAKQILRMTRKGHISCSVPYKNYNQITKDLAKYARDNDIDQYVYAHILITEKKGDEAFKIANKLTQKESVLGYYLLARMQFNGIFFEKDEESAYKYYNKVLEIVPDFAPALHVIAMKYIKSKKYKKAIEILEKNAALGYSPSLIFLANAYDKGQYGLSIDYKKAFKFFKKAAPANSEATVKLGIYYFNGYGCKTNFKKAKKCFDSCIKNNDSNAYYFAALMNLSKDYPKADILLAHDYASKAAELGHSGAMGLYGSLILKSSSSDPYLRKRGEEWIRKGARNGAENAIRLAKEYNIDY